MIFMVMLVKSSDPSLNTSFIFLRKDLLKLGIETNRKNAEFQETKGRGT